MQSTDVVVAIDEGCHQCGLPIRVVGVFESREDAEEVAGRYCVQTGAHSVLVVDSILVNCCTSR